MRRNLISLILVVLVPAMAGSASVQGAGLLYVERFQGQGQLDVVEWDSIYDAGGSNGGVTGGFAWVWHKGECENIIYTHEYNVDTSIYADIEFRFDLRRHSFYTTTPGVSIAVQVAGDWYVSKTVFIETTTIFQTESLVYDPCKDNWDTLNLATANRGPAASADLRGDITGFGLYSSTLGLGTDCTAEYENFTVFGLFANPDFSADGKVDFIDFAQLASSWYRTVGHEDFNDIYDLYNDGLIDKAGLGLFAKNWLLGSKWLYSAFETNREKIDFNAGWKFYKGNPAADFEHVMMEEVGTEQGENNWCFAASTANTGPRDGLMTFNQDYLGGGWGSVWNYPAGGIWCIVYDGRFVPEARPPWPYTIELRCDGNPAAYIPRVEWVSPHPDNSAVKIAGIAMSYSDVGNFKARVLHNGSLVWESSSLAAWKSEPFEVEITDLDNGDIITFMQSSWLAASKLRWHYVTITENSSDPNAPAAVDFNDSLWETVHLPHNPAVDLLWPTWPTFSYEGASWYRKHFTVDNSYDGRKIFLEFGAGSTVTDAWINGIHLTTHYGGYLPFIFDVTDYVSFGQTANLIAVKADNTQNDDVPGIMFYGGIHRDVWMHVTDKLHVTDAVYADKVADGGIFVTYPFVSASAAQIQVKTNVANEYNQSKTCTLKSYIVDANEMVVAKMSDTQVISAASDYTFVQSGTLLNPYLWHPDHPYLYAVYTELYHENTPSDSQQTRIGIRSVEFTKAEGFKINGEVLRFRGANRLQDYPYICYAMGGRGQRRDAVKLKEAGLHYLRALTSGSAFLDACDELGIMIMDRIPGSQYIGGATFRNNSHQNMRDLIRRDRNHACVIAWELSLNETHYDSAFAQTAVAIGHIEYPGSQCYVSGWKYDDIYDIFVCTPTHGARTYTGLAPLIVSEYGHWEYGGLGSTSDVHRADGEEAVLQQAWNHQEGHYLNRGLSNMCGDGVFCASDYQAYPSGFVDKFRLPKFSYYFLQSQREPDVMVPDIDSGPMVFIANYWTSSSPMDVKVYSNCEQVRLYVNDILQDTRGPDTGYPTANLLRPPFTFPSLTWEPGQLRADGYIGGQLVVTHTVNTPGEASSLEITFDTSGVDLVGGGDIIFVYASVIDINGTVVPDASQEVTFNISGPAYLASPPMVNSEAGIATALLRTTTQPGEITITATVPGIDTVTGIITSKSP